VCVCVCGGGGGWGGVTRAGAGPRGQCRLAACPGNRIPRSRIRVRSRILGSNHFAFPSLAAVASGHTRIPLALALVGEPSCLPLAHHRRHREWRMKCGRWWSLVLVVVVVVVERGKSPTLLCYLCVLAHAGAPSATPQLGPRASYHTARAPNLRSGWPGPFLTGSSRARPGIFFPS
jgi:hypothetical protein